MRGCLGKHSCTSSPFPIAILNCLSLNGTCSLRTLRLFCGDVPAIKTKQTNNLAVPMLSPLEFFFQEQGYSSLHSGRSLAWDHVRGDIDDPCSAIADFCGVIADPCGVVAIPEAIGRGTVADSAMPIVARLTIHRKTLLNIVKHHETLVKLREPL